MPYRFVQSRSDRGNIKDIQKAVTDFLQEDPNLPPTPQELRIKSLYERATLIRDRALIDSLGLIVMSGSTTDPVSVMRHRLYVQELTTKFGNKISETKKELEVLVQEAKDKPYEMRVAAYKQENSCNVILSEDGFTKRAGGGCAPRQSTFQRSFWRSK